jgi:ADP-ribose pyrophosphatase YjhB (NUDIX family)
MNKELLGSVWRRLPRKLRHWTARFRKQRFTATAAAVVVDDAGRVLLLDHVFRSGDGWGIPGGFVEAGEQPEAAMRRELREEADMELASAEIAFVRTLQNPSQIEIIFRGRPAGHARAQSVEIKSAAWFALDELPSGLVGDQRRLIERALQDGAKPLD